MRMDLCEAIYSIAPIYRRRPGFGKIRDDIASHMAVCSHRPTGQIKHETVRLGLFFKHQTSLPRHSHAAEEIYFSLTVILANWRYKLVPRSYSLFTIVNNRTLSALEPLLRCGDGLVISTHTAIRYNALNLVERFILAKIFSHSSWRIKHKHLKT